MKRAALIVILAVCALAMAAACSEQPATPSTPSVVTPPADGSTLKATAPVPQSPINGVRIPLGTPVTLVVTNSTTLVTVSLSYRFEVSDAAGAIVESTLVPAGPGTTSRTVTASLKSEQTYRWRARPEYQDLVGPWSAATSFVEPANEGYMRGTELFDPLTNGKTIGTIGGSGNVTFVPGQGIRMNDSLAFVVYQMPQVFSSGEMSVEVTGLFPDAPPGLGKPRIFSMLDRLGSIASSSKYSFNVQYRGAGGAPANCITFKAILGDNANSVEVDDRFANVILLDPSKVYLWQAFWTPISFRLVVKEVATGRVLYDEKSDATSGTTNWNPEKMFAFLGTNNGAFVQYDGTRSGMTLKNLWVGSTPRPTTLGSAIAALR